jgi:hypothetical protein
MRQWITPSGKGLACGYLLPPAVLRHAGSLLCDIIPPFQAPSATTGNINGRQQPAAHPQMTTACRRGPPGPLESAHTKLSGSYVLLVLIFRTGRVATGVCYHEPSGPTAAERHIINTAPLHRRVVKGTLSLTHTPSHHALDLSLLKLLLGSNLILSLELSDAVDNHCWRRSKKFIPRNPPFIAKYLTAASVDLGGGKWLTYCAPLHAHGNTGL